MDRVKFFQRKQKPNETLSQFWNVLKGLASKGEFGDQTQSLVMDVFIANMANETVQRKLTTEPKENPEDVLRFAEAYEEGITQQKSYGNPTMIKDEPVCNVAQGSSNYTKPNRNDAKCFRCGFENFTPAHLKDCRAKNEICNKCKVKGHFARCCRGGTNGKNGWTQKQPTQQKGGAQLKRINAVNSAENSSNESTGDENAVLMVNKGPKIVAPFMMKGKLNDRKFAAIIDSGSPVTIFPRDELKSIL